MYSQSGIKLTKTPKDSPEINSMFKGSKLSGKIINNIFI